jgi:hypothetical protein
LTFPFARTVLVTCALFTLTHAYAASAQSAHLPIRPSAAAEVPAVVPGSEIKVYLMTMGPGDDVWERFGHNALWIHDPSRSPDSVDIAWNWGLFDFAQKDFMKRFIKGNMLYWMAGFDARRTLESFAQENRSVWAQELNLTPDQKVALRAFVENNGRPENKFYHYDYYRDNCSTRVRDAIDLVVGGQVRQATGAQPTGTTFRSHTRMLAEGDVPVYTGLELAMGHNIDRPISAWEEMFLPMKLRDHMRSMRVRDSLGHDVPLVLAETQLYVAKRDPEPVAPPQWTPYYFIAGLAFGVLLIALAIGALGGSRPARAAYTALAMLWTFVAGLLGVLISGLWLFTDHYVTYKNENVLQINPLPLALLVLIPLVVYRQSWRKITVQIAFTIAFLSFFGFVMQIAPFFRQVNGEVIALTLPINIALAWTVSVLANPAQFQRVREVARNKRLR